MFEKIEKWLGVPIKGLLLGRGTVLFGIYILLLVISALLSLSLLHRLLSYLGYLFAVVVAAYLLYKQRERNRRLLEEQAAQREEDE